MSSDFESLLKDVAKEGTSMTWKELGAKSWQDAHSYWTQRLRRVWGMAMIRENAQFKIDRMAYVGNRAAVAQRARTKSAWDKNFVSKAAYEMGNTPRVRFSAVT